MRDEFDDGSLPIEDQPRYRATHYIEMMVQFKQLRHRFNAPWSNRTYIEAAVAVLLMTAALFLSARGSAAIFDHLPHVEDEVAFLFQAKTIASGQLIASAPQYPEFFNVPFVIVQDGEWFGKYPPGYPAVLALGVLAGEPWLVNPIAGALCVGLVYLAGRRLFGSGLTGLLAAALLVSSPFFLLQTSSLLSHVVGLFWAMVALLMFHITRQHRSRLAAVAMGLALGMLFISRPLTAVGIGLPFALFALVDAVRRQRRITLYLPVVAVFLPFGAGFFAYNWLTTGDAMMTAYQLWWPYDHIGFGPDVGVNGHDFGDARRHIRENIGVLDDMLYGWPARLSLVPALLAVGVAVVNLGRLLLNRLDDAAGKRSALAWDFLLIGIVVGLVLCHMLYWTSGQMYGPRYYFEAMGAISLLSARGLLHIADGLSLLMNRVQPARRYASLAAPACVLLLVAGLSGWAARSYMPDAFDQFRDWNGITDADLEQVQSVDMDQAVVLVNRDSWTEYAPFFVQNSPSVDGDVVYAIDRGFDDNRRLMRVYPDRTFYRYSNGGLYILGRGASLSATDP